MNTWRILTGDVREQLSTLPAGCVRTCVTSPPYWGLRDYGVSGQLGLESTPEAYVAAMVGVFAEVRRVLADDGTLWLNLGDSYAGSGRGYGDTKTTNKGNPISRDMHDAMVESGAIGRFWVKPPQGYKQKDLIGIPWMVAFALRADGWYLRSDIIWSKPNPMPESVTDRPTKAHEYIFLLSKSRTYFYDSKAIEEAVSDSFANDRRHVTGSNDRNAKDGYKAAGAQNPKGPHRAFGKHSKEVPQASGRRMTDNVARARAEGGAHGSPFGLTRNKRSVWTVTTKPYPDAHFATYPEDLIDPCILAGSAIGDTVLDPFTGSGTTGAVAIRHQRNFIGVELNPTYVELARKRIRAVAPLLSSEVA